MSETSDLQRTPLRNIATFLLICCCIIFINPLVVYADNGGTTVHITNTGSCYHNEGCSHLRSDIESTLYEATKEGYIPCTDCNPPIYDGPPIEDAEPKKVPHSGGEAASSQTISNRESSSNKTSSTNKSSSVIQEVKPQTNISDYLIISGILFVIVGIPLILVSKEAISMAKEKRIKKAEFEKEKKLYHEMYAGKDPLSLVDVPDGVFLEDGYPCTANKQMGIWGDYTVYVARKSRKVFHLNPRCGGTSLVPINYYQANKLQHCKKCAVGKIKLPELSWYIEYLRITEIKKKYDIE